MFCTNCGKQISENAKFCTGCGISLETAQPLEEKEIVTEEIVQEEIINETPATEIATEEIQQEEPQAVNVEQPTEEIFEEPVIETVEKVATTPIQQPAAESLPKKEGKFIKTLLSVLCCAGIFIITVLAMLLFTFRGSIAPERVINIFNKINIREIVREEDIKENIILDLTNSEIETIYEEGTIKEFIGDKLVECSNYILHGIRPEDIYAEDFVELMKENEDVIYEETGLSLTRFHYRQIESMGERLESGTEINLAVKSVKTACSVVVLIALCVIVALLCFLLFKARRKNYDVLLWSGSTFVVVAVMFAVAGLVAKLFLSKFLSPLGEVIFTVADLYVTSTLSVLLVNSGILLLFGAVLILIYKLIKWIKTKRTAK